ncbi:MAG: HlyC/CorC family transporter [Deltaproteobacteria bacterium]|nr:HlyC/CorC family transporter [Deltaproteobacteria bacterium]
MSLIVQLLLAAALVGANAFFVAAEFAIVKVRVTRLEELEKRGKAGARVARTVTQHLDMYLSVSQIGITLASLGLGWIGEPAVAAALHGPLALLGLSARATHTVAFAVGFALITVTHVIFGEQAPKLFALHKAEATTLALAVPLRIFHVVLFPFIWMVNTVTKLVLKPLGLRDVSEQDGQPGYSEQELRILLARSGTAGLVDQDAIKVVQRALSFPSRTARQIMIPRSQVEFFHADETLDGAIVRADESGHTRFPVAAAGGDLDDATGIVHLKDILLAMRRESRASAVGALAQKPLYVPETLAAPQILRAFHGQGSQMALVVDEHGGTAGIITLADVVQEVMGPLPDEGEGRPSTVPPESADVIEGSTPLTELAERIGVQLDGKQPATVAGYLIQVLEKIPGVGERTKLGAHSLIVETVEGPRVARIRVVPAIPPREGGPGSAS